MAHTPAGLPFTHTPNRKSINIVAVIQPAVLVFVVSIITSIIAPGFVIILPALNPVISPLYILRFIIGMWLSFNTVFNYVATVLKPAGALIASL